MLDQYNKCECSCDTETKKEHLCYYIKHMNKSGLATDLATFNITGFNHSG